MQKSMLSVFSYAESTNLICYSHLQCHPPSDWLAGLVLFVFVSATQAEKLNALTSRQGVLT